jgi:hypothetical protein
MKTHRVKPPEMVIDGITQYSNGLVVDPFYGGKYFKDIFPSETLNL